MKSIIKQIIALGGGGFSDNPENILLDKYILNQTGKDKPKILFSPAAGGDNIHYIEKFYNFYSRLNCVPSHITISKRKYTEKKLKKIFLSQDVIFFGGGSPAFLMKKIRENHLTPILRSAWDKGIVLSGMSAGGMIWFEDGFKNPKDEVFLPIRCLGFLKGSFCPHYDSSYFLRKNYLNIVKSDIIKSGYGVEDGAALHFVGSTLKHVVVSENEKSVYLVGNTEKKIRGGKILPLFSKI